MSGYRPRPYRISIWLAETAIPAFRAAPLYPIRNFYPVNMLSPHRSKIFLKFFEKTCQECVSEDIYRMKGIRVWVPAQATRQGRADIGTALLFPAVLPAVFDTRGRQGGGTPLRGRSLSPGCAGAFVSRHKTNCFLVTRQEGCYYSELRIACTSQAKVVYYIRKEAISYGKNF